MVAAPGPGTFAAMSLLDTALETTVRTADAAATQRLGAALAPVAEAGDLIALWGDLGAGKTQFAKGFGAGLGVEDTVTSPSFVLMAEYEGRLRLFHQDLYRLADAGDALAGGLVDDRQADRRDAGRVARADGRGAAGGAARRPDRGCRRRAAHDHDPRDGPGVPAVCGGRCSGGRGGAGAADDPDR